MGAVPLKPENLGMDRKASGKKPFLTFDIVDSIIPFVVLLQDNGGA